MELAKLIILFFGLFLGGIIALAVFRTVTRNKRADYREAGLEAKRVAALMNKSAAKNTLDVSVPVNPAPFVKTDVRGMVKNNIYYNSVLGLKIDFAAEGRQWKLLTGEELHRYQAQLMEQQYGSDFAEKYDGLDEGFLCLAASTADSRCNVTVNASLLDEEALAGLTPADLFCEESIAAIADGLTAAGASGVATAVETRMLGGKAARVIVARGATPYGSVCQVAYRVLSGEYQVNLVITTYNGDDSRKVFDACSPI